MTFSNGIPAIEARIASAQPREDGDLTWLPAWRIRQLIASREVSPVEVTEHFLQRIKTLDGQLRAFRMVDENGARAQAQEAEKRMLAGESLGPLDGIPIALKEHIPASGLTWHNLATGQKAIAPRDSIEAERLRGAGAVIVGSLIAGGVDLSRAEDPRNPWDLERVAGISSPGSGIASAAALVPLTIAADGLGSTRLPAALCGQVGLHLTRGLVPSIAFDVLNPRMVVSTGPITRDVRDAATVLKILAGPDGRDFGCLQGVPADPLVNLDAGARGMRLVWTDDFGFAGAHAGPLSQQIIATVRAAAMQIQTAGADIETTGAVWDDTGWLGLAALSTDPVINQVSLLPPENVPRAQEIRQRIWRKFHEVLRDKDFILSPTAQFIAPMRDDWIESWKDPQYMATYTVYTAAANLLGWPAITVPAGFVSGLPVGLQIMGKPESEPRMLQLARAFLQLQTV